MVQLKAKAPRRIGELVQFADTVDDVYLLQYSVTHHENDTDDIVEELNPENYNKKHSKLWNAKVAKKAKELEDELKLEETMEKKKEEYKAQVKAR
jgi:hypothetical protein